MDIETWITVALLAAATIPFVIAISRANELFLLDVTEGKPRLLRGKIPRRLMRELRDVLERPPVARARVRATVENGRPFLRASGAVTEQQVQRMRNLIGFWSKDQIRSGVGVEGWK